MDGRTNRRRPDSFRSTRMRLTQSRCESAGAAASAESHSLMSFSLPNYLLHPALMENIPSAGLHCLALDKLIYLFIFLLEALKPLSDPAITAAEQPQRRRLLKTTYLGPCSAYRRCWLPLDANQSGCRSPIPKGKVVK